MTMLFKSINNFKLPLFSVQSIARLSIQRAYSSDFLKPTVFNAGSRLEIKIPKWPKSLHVSYIWLRDHCRCDKCYDKNTSQRLFDPTSVKLDISPIHINPEDNRIIIEWPDKHVSSYDYEFLWRNIFEGEYSHKGSNRHLWKKMTFPSLENVSVPLKKMNTPLGKTNLIKSILKYGIGIVNSVPAEVKDTVSTTEKLCESKDTFYGKFWELEADSSYADSAYSNVYLGGHTDATYFNHAPRIQVFHCVKPAKEGGETLLIDGFYVAEQFKEKFPKNYAFLSENGFLAEYIGDEQHLKAIGPIIEHCKITGSLRRLRYNMYDRAPVSSIPFQKIETYYESITNLSSMMNKPAYAVWLKLKPDQVLFVDNWRVLHGRNYFQGHRKLAGNYLDHDSFVSKANCLGFNIN